MSVGIPGSPRSRAVTVSAGDSASVDAFGRWRVSEPQTLFDSKLIFNDSDLAEDVENHPLIYDNQEISGGGTSTAYIANQSAQSVSVSASTAGRRVRQTKMRFNYQPGKSQLVLMTFNTGDCVAGVTKREGIFDDQNGLFLELSDDVYLCRRSYVTGSAVDTKVKQSDWNIDSMDGSNRFSRIDLDFTKTQILIIDYEWLGVGRVRMGFVIDGLIYYAHEFLNANNLATVYMTTPNLPLRTEIQNDGTGEACSMVQICSSVMSEGGSQDLGVIRSASTDGTHIDANTENTIYAIIGIRLKSNYIGTTIKVLNVALQEQAGSKKLEWMLLLNPTVAGTFAYVDESLSAIAVARGAVANTVTGGYRIAGGYLESAGVPSGAAGSSDKGIDNAIRLGSTIAGVTDTLVLCARPIGGSSNTDIEGSITWREIV